MEKTLVNTKLELRVHHDSDAPNPIDKEWDEGILGTFVCWHSRYDLGHSNEYFSPVEFMIGLVSSFDLYRSERLEQGYEDGFIDDSETIASCEKWIEKEGIVILPLYLHDHSGLTISTSSFHDRWDSGQVGYVYASKNRIKALGLEDKDNTWIENSLNKEVELYDSYLRGDVYWFEIVELNEDGEDLDTVDSCSGFYGNDMKENGMIDNFDLTDEEKEQVLIYGTDAYSYLRD